MKLNQNFKYVRKTKYYFRLKYFSSKTRNEYYKVSTLGDQKNTFILNAFKIIKLKWFITYSVYPI